MVRLGRAESMRNIILGIIIGSLICVGVYAFGEKPYDDTSLVNKITRLTTDLDKQEKIIKEQRETIKYLIDVLGEHQEVIIGDQERIKNLEKNTVKEILIKR